MPQDSIQLGKKVIRLDNLGPAGVRLAFSDGSSSVVDLVVGADGIRSVVRDAVWSDYRLDFTGTTIWRVLLPTDAIKDLDPRFMTTGWWHGPTTHVYFSPGGNNLWEIAARAWQDPVVHGAEKVSWGTPVQNEVVEAHFTVSNEGIKVDSSLMQFMLVGLSPSNKRSLKSRPKGPLEGVRRLCRPGARHVDGVEQPCCPCRRLIARAFGRFRIRCRVCNGGWLGTSSGAGGLQQ